MLPSVCSLLQHTRSSCQRHSKSWCVLEPSPQVPSAILSISVVLAHLTLRQHLEGGTILVPFDRQKHQGPERLRYARSHS